MYAPVPQVPRNTAFIVRFTISIEAVCATLILAWCVGTGAIAQPALLPPLTRETLTQPLSVGKIILPPGSQTVVTGDDQHLVSARISQSMQWPGTSIPAETLIIFRKSLPYIVILPNNTVGTTNGQPIAGGVSYVSGKPITPALDWKGNCEDFIPWLAPWNQWSGSFFSNTHAPARLIQILSSSVPLWSSPAPHQQFILSSTYISPDFSIPVGSVLTTSDDATKVTGIYTNGSAMITGFIVPDGSYVTFASGEVIVSAPVDFQLGPFLIAADSDLALDGDYAETIDSMTLAKSTVLSYGITVEAGTRVSFLAGQLALIFPMAPTSIRGFPVDQGRIVCFTPAGLANLPLAADTSWHGILFSKDSFIITDLNADVVESVLSNPIAINGARYYRLPSNPNMLPTANFWPSGRLRDGWLTQQSTISGISVAPGLVALREDGGIDQATLATDQVIQGIPCLANSQIIFDECGNPLMFTVSADWSLGATHLKRGDRFGGIFTVNDSITLMDGATLNAAVSDIQNDFVDELIGKIKDKSSKFPYGNIGTISKHDFRFSFSQDSMDTHQEVSVQNFLNNSPFADCDGNISADASIRWALSYSRFITTMSVWMSTLSGEITYGFCPTTAALQLAYNAWALVRGEQFSISSKLNKATSSFQSRAKITKSVQNSMLAKIDDLLPTLKPNAKVLPLSLQITRVYISNGQLQVDFSYQASLLPN